MHHRRTRRIVTALVAVGAFALLAACGPAAPPIASTPQADDIVARTNFTRQVWGIGPMTVDGNMQANAQFAAERVARQVGSACTNLQGWMHSAELGAWYPGQSAAENLACVPGCPADGALVVDMWWGSPSHRNNMMDARYGFTGTAVSCNGSVMIAVGQYRSG